MDSPMLTPKVLRSTAKLPETPALERIGYGTGVGVFNLNRDEKSPWAAKIISRHAGRDRKQYSNRLQLEAKVLSSLNHPNVIGYRAFVKRPDGREILLMEQCEQSLCDLIELRVDQCLGPFPNKYIEKVAVDIANALDYLHTSLVLHGDIKSGNILVKNNFEIVKLCDFGVSLPLKTDGTLHRVKGHKAMYVGTPCWSAPEVLKGDECLGAIITSKADIFSYGLVFWEMMTLSVPNTSTAIDESYYTGISDDLDAHLGESPPIPASLIVDPNYKQIINLYQMCTIQDYLKRPSAKQILYYIDNFFFDKISIRDAESKISSTPF
ncbi:Protein kinase domain,Protein kinase-like domain,Serine/threonine-protein kinase, active site [Cinara cedri]|uniref:Protein kinase domain,Protein kinase-like domain,Serine/threonine-protein kinase, active site n=1 Tax=Cinara cedri TaxID=506608 RepID=A0A5E4MP78_9HEMI|nr:Protein kinase domain,Protein kinase-like domain,Serine/threonine-protein kinase, active site [Cinara cedri]